MDVEAFSRTLGYSFSDPALLRRALTHRSHSATHNERLEYLGDSVLNCAIALELYRKFPDLPEGELSRLRANLVSQESLAAIGAARGFGQQLRLGEGELKTGGARRPSILGDAVEAVIGAVFLDGGFDAAHAQVRRLFEQSLQAIDPRTTGKNPKTLLQELLQGRRLPLPRYAVVATSGEAHEQMFQVECSVTELGITSRGEGTTRQGAEQDAARRAYELATAR